MNEVAILPIATKSTEQVEEDKHAESESQGNASFEFEGDKEIPGPSGLLVKVCVYLLTTSFDNIRFNSFFSLISTHSFLSFSLVLNCLFQNVGEETSHFSSFLNSEGLKLLYSL